MPVNTDALMQMLSGVGAGLNQQPWTQALNKMVQSGYSSKNQFSLIDVFKQILGEGVTDSKILLDDKGMKLDLSPKMISKAFGGGSEGGGMGAPSGSAPKQFASNLPGVQAPNVQAPSMPNLPTQGQGGFLSGLLNPSDSQSDNISAANLIGLSPQDVSNALSGALNIEQMNQAKAMQPIDMMYKGALTTQALANAQLDRNYPIPHPEYGTLTLRQWQGLPTSEKEYAAYVSEARKLGDSDIMSRREFEMLEPTEKEQFLRSAMADPALMEAEKQLRKAGATNINISEKVQQKIALGQAEGQVFFDSGKWIKDVQDYAGSKQARVDEVMSGKPKSQLVYERIVESIVGRGGEIVSEPKWSEDGKFLIFKVKWPSGDIREYKHAVVE